MFDGDCHPIILVTRPFRGLPGHCNYASREDVRKLIFHLDNKKIGCILLEEVQKQSLGVKAGIADSRDVFVPTLFDGSSHLMIPTPPYRSPHGILRENVRKLIFSSR